MGVYACPEGIKYTHRCSQILSSSLRPSARHEHRTSVIMVVASTVRRALSNAPSLTSCPLAPQVQGKRRLMGTAAVALAEQAPIDIQIFDIFDAPSRLGESSKLLRQSSAARASTARADRTMSTRSSSPSARRHFKPLPAPILYDGPACPPHGAHLAYGGLTARNAHSYASSEASPDENLLSSLPPPVVFDGPSRLKRYGRDTSREMVSLFAIHKIHQD